MGYTVPFLIDRSTRAGQAKNLAEQAGRATDPNEKSRLEYMAALESKYAEATNDAQQGVQDAATRPRIAFVKGSGTVPGMDLQYQKAKSDRGAARDRAAWEYNAKLPAGYAGPRKGWGNPFYG